MTAGAFSDILSMVHRICTFHSRGILLYISNTRNLSFPKPVAIVGLLKLPGWLERYMSIRDVRLTSTLMMSGL